jgi:hypothetical protein
MGTKNNPGKWDCYENAEPDEPMFILLGRDAMAPDLVDEWARRRELAGEDRAKTQEARLCAADMRAYRANRQAGTYPEIKGSAIYPIPPGYRMLGAGDEVLNGDKLWKDIGGGAGVWMPIEAALESGPVTVETSTVPIIRKIEEKGGLFGSEPML